MPLLNFPAPGAPNGQQLLEEFGGFSVTPSSNYKYINLFTWSENLTKTPWTRISDNQTITSDYNFIKDYIFDSDFVESSGVTITLATDTTPVGTSELNYEVKFGSKTTTFGQTVAVQANTQYTLSFYARRGLSTTANVFYRIFDNTNSSNIVARTDYLNQISANVRARVSVTFTTPANCNTITTFLVDQPAGVPGSIKLYKPQLEQGSLASIYSPTNSVSLASLGFTSNVGQEVKDSGILSHYFDPGYEFAPVLFVTGISTVKYQTVNEHIFDENLLRTVETASATKTLYFPVQDQVPYAVGGNVRIRNYITGTSGEYLVLAATNKSITITTNDALNSGILSIARTFGEVYDQNKIIADFSRRTFSQETSTALTRYYIANYYGIPYKSRVENSFETVNNFSPRDTTTKLLTNNIKADIPLREAKTAFLRTEAVKKFLDVRADPVNLKQISLVEKQLEKLRSYRDSDLNLSFTRELKLGNNFVVDASVLKANEKLSHVSPFVEAIKNLAKFSTETLKYAAVMREAASHYQKTDIPISSFTKTFTRFFTQEVFKDIITFTKPVDTLAEFAIENRRRQIMTLANKPIFKLIGFDDEAIRRRAGIVTRLTLNSNLELITDLRRAPGQLQKRDNSLLHVLDIDVYGRRVTRIESNNISFSANTVTNFARSIYKSSYTATERYLLDVMFPALGKTNRYNYTIQYPYLQNGVVDTLIDIDDNYDYFNLRKVGNLGRIARTDIIGIWSPDYDKQSRQVVPLKLNIGIRSEQNINYLIRPGKIIQALTVRASPHNLTTPGMFKPIVKVGVVDDIGKLRAFSETKFTHKVLPTSDVELARSQATLSKFVNEGAVGPVIPVTGQSGITNNFINEYLFDTDIILVTAGNTSPTQTLTINPVVKLESPAVYFDGYRDYVETNATNMLAFGPTATIEMMIRPMASTSLQVISSFWNNAVNYYNDKIDIYLNASLQVCVGIVYPILNTTASEYLQYCRTEKSLSTSVMNHLAIVANDNTIYVYINGEQQRMIGATTISGLGVVNQMRIAYAGDVSPVWVSANTVFTISTLSGSRSTVPILAVDPKGMGIRYAIAGQPEGIRLDPDGFFTRINAAPSTIEVVSPSFTVYATNGYTTISRQIRIRTVPEIIAEYLIIGGGGGGGSDMGGGGGAGGFITGNINLNLFSPLTVTVGAGGTGAPSGTVQPRGSNGGFSSIMTATETNDARFYSIQFDGRNDSIMYGTSSAFASGLQSFGFEAWIYVYEFKDSTRHVIATTYADDTTAQTENPGSGWTLFIRSTSNIKFLTFTYGISGFQLVNAPIDTGTWYHVAITYKQSTGRFGMWLNGDNVVNINWNIAASTASGLGMTRQSFAIGDYTGAPVAATGTNSTTFNGMISNARYVVGSFVYDPAGDLASKANIVVPTGPLSTVSNTVVLGAQSVTSNRNNANLGLVATVNGNPVTTAFNPFSGGVKSDAFPFVPNIISTPVQGNIELINNRKYAVHTFTVGNSFFTVNQPGSDRIEIFMWGGGGAGGRPGGWGSGSNGGAGAAARAELRLAANVTYYTVVGGGGIYTTFQGANGGGGIVSRNGSDNSYGGGGGGYSGLFTSAIPNQSSALLIAAGGGGGGSSRAGTGNFGGGGGWPTGQDGLSPYDGKTSYRGLAGTQYDAGADASSDGANTLGFQGALQGGSPRTNSYGGAGGGGWFGGSGGGYSEPNTMGGGAGGSSYFSPFVTNPVMSSANYTTPGDSSNPLRGTAGAAGGVSTGGNNGVIIIRYPIEPIYAVNGERVAQGGGGGASTHDQQYTNSYANHGGSGGGASGQWQNFGQGTTLQGFRGGGSIGTWYPAGGGGAAGVGTTNIANGGPGLPNSFLGTTYFFAGGGGGAGYSNWGGNGGLGGGGGGAPRSSSTAADGAGDRNSIAFAGNATVGSLNSQTNVPGGAGAANSGGGGGGGSHYNVNNFGGTGGSGIVLIRYQGDRYFTGGAITRVGNYTVHAFYNSDLLSVGSFQISGGGTVIEGDTIIFPVSFSGVFAPITVFYTVNTTLGNVSPNDISTGSNSFTVTGGDAFGAGSYQLAIQSIENLTRDNNRNLVIDLRLGSTTGGICATSPSVIIAESLIIPAANIAITTPKFGYYEGETITFTITANVPNGTNFYYTVSQDSVSDQDFTTTPQGIVTFTNNIGLVSLTTTTDPDNTAESFALQLRNRSVSSRVIASSANIFVWAGSEVVAQVMAVGGGGAGGARDNSFFNSGIEGGGAGAAYTQVVLTPGANVAVYVGGGGSCNGGESQNFSNPGGFNGGGAGGRSGQTGFSGAGGGGGGWSGAALSGSYLVVAGGGGGGGGGGEGNADNFAGGAGGARSFSIGSMNGGAGQDFGTGDGGSAGGGGGGATGGGGGGINGGGAGGGTSYATGFEANTYVGSGTSSGSLPTNIATAFGYSNGSAGGGGGRTGGGANGIVIVQYPGGQKASGGAISTVNGNTVHRFATPGIYYLQF